MKGSNGEEYFGRDHITLIQATHGWRSLNIRELWAYRELLWVLMERDLRVRYKQTVLGAGWAVLQPLMLMVVFSIFFGRLAKLPSDGVPYPVFAYSALVPWTFFASALGSASNSLVGSSHLISKVYFPRLIIPLSSIGSWIVDFVIASVILLALVLFYGIPITPGLIAVPFLLVALAFCALGIGTALSALTVAYRDFRYLVPFLIQIWMFITPVLYPASLVPERWRWVFSLNPMAGLIEGFRSAFLARPFDASGILIGFAVSCALFSIGVVYFAQVERRFADII